MDRPKINIEKNFLDKSIDVLAFFLIVISAILIGVYYSELPDKLPIHFNWPSKDKNGLGTKDLLWASPIICGIIIIGIYKLNQYPWVFNYPTEITETNAKSNYKMATQMLRFLGLIIGVMCFYLTLISILSGLGNPTEFDKYLGVLFPVLLTGLPVIYVVKMLIDKNTN